jgi:stage III sporulation protein AA
MNPALEQAAQILPLRLREAVQSQLTDAEELHLRSGRILTWCASDGRERPVLVDGKPLTVTGEELLLTLELATRASYHTVERKLSAGFLPLRGGHRLGLVGTADLREGELHGMQSLSSLCLRVAHPVQGMADILARQLFEAPRPLSALILSPPGGGKTTLLRELLRLASDRYGLRPSLADERGEVAALWNGEPQLEVGVHTDVLDGCPKAQGMLLLLRSMSPQLLAADEITAPEDVAALSSAANCSVPVLATAHAACLAELTQRPLYRRILEERIFSHAVLIQRDGKGRRYELVELNA